eukprot:15886604-Heterocapsa_arctica.AAC.1
MTLHIFALRRDAVCVHNASPRYEASAITLWSRGLITRDPSHSTRGKGHTHSNSAVSEPSTGRRP